MLRVDLVNDIGDDKDADSSVISSRDIRVDHDDFNPVDDSCIVRELPTSSHAIEKDSLGCTPELRRRDWRQDTVR